MKPRGVTCRRERMLSPGGLHSLVTPRSPCVQRQTLTPKSPCGLSSLGKLRTQDSHILLPTEMSRDEPCQIEQSLNPYVPSSSWTEMLLDVCLQRAKLTNLDEQRSSMPKWNLDAHIEQPTTMTLGAPCQTMKTQNQGGLSSSLQVRSPHVRAQLKKQPPQREQSFAEPTMTQSGHKPRPTGMLQRGPFQIERMQKLDDQCSSARAQNPCERSRRQKLLNQCAPLS
mmetsp:Transcript_69105/g.156671  ORF Transcript_69105/g.156671 Transcript_69105/m.156671 type:complete len:226 (-) Transcript_69105:109-786(-)